MHKRPFGLFIRGIAIGLADLVPGVSGGTIALVTGIYAPLLTALQAFDARALRLLKNAQWRDLAKHIHLPFLLIVGAGAATSIFSAAPIIHFLIQNHPIALWSFFWGLLWTSIVPLLVHLPWTKPNTYVSCLMGAVAAFALTRVSQINIPNTPWILPITGAIAISATLLPGVSGSFVLLLIGQYERIIQALKSLQWNILFAFAIGAICGGVLLAKWIHLLLQKHYAPTIAFLMGCVMGATPKLWPWKLKLPNGHELPLRPDAFQSIYHEPPQIGLAILWATTGAGIVLIIRAIAKRGS